MVEADGYILRIASEEWVHQVFELVIYYTNIRRNWQNKQITMFVHKSKNGDAFIGYGEVGNIRTIDELSKDEKRACEKRRWKKAIEFKYVIRFDNPLPIRKTFLKNLKLRGRCLHGFPLKKEQIASITSQAEHCKLQNLE